MGQLYSRIKIKNLKDYWHAGGSVIIEPKEWKIHDVLDELTYQKIIELQKAGKIEVEIIVAPPEEPKPDDGIKASQNAEYQYYANGDIKTETIYDYTVDPPVVLKASSYTYNGNGDIYQETITEDGKVKINTFYYNAAGDVMRIETREG